MDRAQDKYRSVLIEIKRRTEVIDAFVFGKADSLYVPTTIESAYLQLRKILELIAFSSLIANIDVYSKAYIKFSTHWNASLMLKDIERINPNFYPKPIIQKPSRNPDFVSEWSNRENDFLTKDDFLSLYENCGKILHAENPYGSRVDIELYGKSLPAWRTKIVNLLNAHTIRLINDNNIYLFQMGPIGKNPSYNAFAVVDDKPSS